MNEWKTGGLKNSGGASEGQKPTKTERNQWGEVGWKKRKSVRKETGKEKWEGGIIEKVKSKEQQHLRTFKKRLIKTKKERLDNEKT